MGRVAKLERKITAKEAEDLVHKLSENSSNVRMSKHAQDRMEERDISYIDTLNVLRQGCVLHAPEKSGQDEWKCKVIRHARGNRDIGVVTIILNRKFLKVITVEWEDLR